VPLQGNEDVEGAAPSAPKEAPGSAKPPPRLPATGVDRVLRRFRRGIPYTTYVLAAVVPPRPVQLVWKNSPRGLSTRS